MPRKKNLRTIVIILATSGLCGCALFNQDGIDTLPRNFDITVYNSASQKPPYTLVMGNPIPDLAWTRERASECEPWFPGDNGCEKLQNHTNASNSNYTAPAEPEAPQIYHGS